MSNLVIGYGEIGKAVKEAICPDAETLDSSVLRAELEGEYEILHICFPYTESFVDDVMTYAARFNPKCVVIYSTVPIGTTKKIPCAIHSPVEGKHPDLTWSIDVMERWIAHNDIKDAQVFNDLCLGAGLKTRMINNTDFTEALKLLSTTEYGINIEFARYKKHVADKIGMDYDLTKQWNYEYNRLYKTLGLDTKYQKFVLDAPDGSKGGHCVTPNARLLNEQFPSELTKIVGEL